MSVVRRLAMSTAVALSLFIPAASSNAATLSLDGGWSEFSFGGVGSSWSDTFDFTILDTAYLWVTDAFLSGDQFEVFSVLGPTSLGLTLAPGSVGDQIGADYDAAFADPRWSSGEFVFGAGTHTVSGLVTLSPFGGGGGAIQLSSTSATVVPLPATGLLLISGLGAVAALRRKRKSKAV